jgi:glycosyltransferase involved in cell wall biosynthesis
MDKVSVIIPVLNGAAFIHNAIESVANQTYGNFELIVIDDGSADNSIDVARSSMRNCGISGRVVQRPNPVARGAGSCRNLGVSLAAGEFVAFLDADDKWKPLHLERAMAMFARNGETMGAYSAMCEKIDAKGNAAGQMPEQGFPASGLQDALPFLLQGMFIPTVTLCIRTREFQRTMGFSETLSCYEDWWLVLQLATSTRFFFDADVGCEVRIGAASLTRVPSSKSERVAMSDAMYCDQLRLVANAKAAGFLRQVQLTTLRRNVIEWNARQLNDLISSGQFVESARIFRALNRSSVMELVIAISARALSGVGMRGTAKLKRLIFRVG